MASCFNTLYACLIFEKLYILVGIRVLLKGGMDWKMELKMEWKNEMEKGTEMEKVASNPYQFNDIFVSLLKIHFLSVSLLLGKFNNV